MYISSTENEVMMDIHQKILHNIPYVEMNTTLDLESLGKKRDLMIEIENQYGTFKYDTEKAITFPKGLLGVEEFNIYGLRKLQNANMNYMLLQSLEASEISFIVMPLLIDADGINLKDAMNVCDQIGIKNYKEVTFFGILSMKSTEITINLKAPILLDCKNQLAWQVVMSDNKYCVEHSLLKVCE